MPSNGPSRVSREHLEHLRRAAALDAPEALCALGELARDGAVDARGRVLVARHPGASQRSFRRAAELGHPEGMRCIADALAAAGRFAEARRWYLRAVRLGDGVAAFNLAITWQRTGRHALAVRWLRRASRGDDAALLELARAELAGLGTRRDVPAALRKLQRVVRSRSVCQLDREDAMLMLYDVYRQGWLVPRNFHVALRWLRRAASAGSHAARGLLRDLDEAETP